MEWFQPAWKDGDLIHWFSNRLYTSQESFVRFLRGVIAFPCGRRGMITMREPNVERLLINATQPDIEVRFAIINSKGELENAYIEQPGSQEKNNS